MKITFFSSCTAGGAERMTLLYAKIMRDYGYQCSIVMTKWRNNIVLLPYFIPSDIPYHIIDLKHAQLANYRIAIRMFLEKSDIIFCSQPGNTKRLLKMKALGLIKQKIVFRDFLMPHDQIKNPGEKNVDILSKADAIIAQTEEMKEEMIYYYHMKPSSITVINNPLDKALIKKCIKEADPFDHSFTNYLAINRVDPQKDMETMFKAFSIILKHNPYSRLYVCGNISNTVYLDKLERLANELRIKDNIFIEGPQSNPFRYLYNADVFCLSSIYEGLPNGMLEAMYLGVPVAVTKSIPYISQVVHEGVNGYLSDIMKPQSFADAMIKASKLKRLEKYVDINQSEKKIIALFEQMI